MKRYDDGGTNDTQSDDGTVLSLTTDPDDMTQLIDRLSTAFKDGFIIIPGMSNDMNPWLQKVGA